MLPHPGGCSKKKGVSGEPRKRDVLFSFPSSSKLRSSFADYDTCALLNMVKLQVHILYFTNDIDFTARYQSSFPTEAKC